MTRFVFALAVVGVTAGSAQAASIVVTTTVDVMATDGLCSLREAIRSANNNIIIPAVPGECASGDALPTIDVITFAGPGVYTLALPGRGENLAAIGDLDITESLTIAGTANLNVPITIDAQGIDRVFHVLPPAVATFTGPLRIRGGHAKEDGLYAGGGILSEGALVLDGVEVTDNTASCAGEDRVNSCDSYGGGIASLAEEAPQTIQNSLVWDNLVTCSGIACAARGGGIANGRTAMTVNGSQVLSNKASCAAEQCLAGGGGIFAIGFITLAGYDEVTGNAAECGGPACASRGGGIHALTILDIQPSGFLTPLSLIDRNLANCLGDNCGARGGGIFMRADGGGGTLMMVAQVSNNEARCLFGTVICSADGGGIYNEGASMSITSSLIAGNLSVCSNPDCNSAGGGIFNEASRAALIADSTLRHNDTECETFHCQVAGGGMFQGGTGEVSIYRSTFESNHASCSASDGVPCFADGAGLLVSNQSSAVIRRSTFFANSTVCSHNDCRGHGGAVYLDDNVDAIIENSTFSHNSATRGGAVFNLGSITVTFGTFADNSAGEGSGLFLFTPLVNTIRHSIFANSPPGANCKSDGNVILMAAGSNMSSDGSCTSFTYHNTNPKLGVLGYYGGLTKTRPLIAGSPAIDAASICTDAFGEPVAIDQRNFPRPDGAACDYGAYEGVLSVSFTGLLELVERFSAQHQVSLGAVLRAAAQRLTDRNPANDGAGCGQLGAFIHQVGALEKRQDLTRDQAGELQLAAMNLQALYGCGSLPSGQVRP